ncbi:hypothetical protein D3C80_1697220 [compost metagenome]
MAIGTPELCHSRCHLNLGELFGTLAAVGFEDVGEADDQRLFLALEVLPLLAVLGAANQQFTHLKTVVDKVFTVLVDQALLVIFQ